MTNRREVALDLHEKGWYPFPLPAGKKKDPPRGRTGYSGRNMMRGEIDAYDWGESNIGIRMPDGVIALDADLYKQGGAADWEALVERCGELPPTWMTTAREDGSGHRLFRVPVGTALGNPAPTIEVLQWFHRYSIVWPSTNDHAEGAEYRWYDEAEGDWQLDAPEVADLPELPWSWIEALQVDAREARATGKANQAEVQAFLAEHTASDHEKRGALRGVVSTLERTRESKGRHDTLVDIACMTMREAQAGWYPAVAAIGLLQEWWETEMSSTPKDRERRDSPEFGNAICYAIKQALAERPDDEQDEDEPEESTYDPVDLGPWLDGTVTIPTPDLLRLDDGRGLLYIDRLNMLHGDSGSGKSWLEMVAIREMLRDRRPVALVDLEDNAGVMRHRLDQIGVEKDEIRELVTFIAPRDPWTTANVERMLGHLIERKVEHVFIDSLGEAFGLEGVNENDDVDVASWFRRVAHTIVGHGIGVTLIDHVPKSTDNPLHPSGSKRKRAAITGADWFVSTENPMDRETGGTVDVTCGKDRHGNYQRGARVGRMEMTIVGGLCSTRMMAFEASEFVELLPDLPLEAHIANVLEKYHPDPLGTKAVGRELRSMGVSFAQTDLAGALELMAVRGLVIEDDGPRNSRLWTYLRDWEPMGPDEYLRRRAVDNE